MSAHPGLTDSPEYHALYDLLNHDALEVEHPTTTTSTPERLRAARQLREGVDELIRRIVYDLRPEATWQQIGDALGTSRQAAQEKYRRR